MKPISPFGLRLMYFASCYFFSFDNFWLKLQPKSSLQVWSSILSGMPTIYPMHTVYGVYAIEVSLVINYIHTSVYNSLAKKIRFVFLFLKMLPNLRFHSVKYYLRVLVSMFHCVSWHYEYGDQNIISITVFVWKDPFLLLLLLVNKVLAYCFSETFLYFCKTVILNCFATYYRYTV